MHHHLRSCTEKLSLLPAHPSTLNCPYGCQLSEVNRWVKMAQVIPWSEFESEYAQNFPTDMGLSAKSFRMALGALIIKEKLGISDRVKQSNKSAKTHIYNTLSVN